MPEAGEYILVHVGFSPAGKPFITLQKDTVQQSFDPFGKVFTLRFDTSRRFCTGWYDLATGTHTPCPDAAQTDTAYSECAACQKRTGFNPAFYNATSISPQQEARNAEPHILYIAHFGKNVVKVGISHAARNTARLLEQGARSAIILETFPSATIARQYEAKIAALPGIAETIQHRKKQDLLKTPYDAKNAHHELFSTLDQIQKTLSVTFDSPTFHSLDKQYLPSALSQLGDIYDSSSHGMITGSIVGMIGTILLASHQETTVSLPMKKFVGYPVTLIQEEQTMPLPARQMTLF